MGYRDDVYAVWNIVGYTGKLNDFPTVYFVSPDTVMGGHITQKHGLPTNVGRQAVFSLQGYTYRNETYDGKFRLVERWPNGGIHPSRNPMVEIDQDNPDMRVVAVLAQAITNCPEEKYISEVYDEDKPKILGAMKAKKAFGTALKQANRMIARMQHQRTGR